jgi:uncharacterized 2Fe-2S/4Fe-4S cluster protein (DUF4445 family)
LKTFTVRLVPLDKEIPAREGTRLLDILHEYGIEFPCGGKGRCGKCRIKVLEGRIEADQIHLEKLKALGLGEEWRLACRSVCVSNLLLEVGQYETLIQADETLFEFTPRKGVGLAFDLGTTTLVGQMLNLETGRILAVEKALNPQRKLGSDLVSRLEASLRNGSQEATRLIREKIGFMVGRMMGGREESLDQMVIVGNTVMHHFFCGLDITPLSFYPFESPHLDMFTFSSGELGWNIGWCNSIRFYPPIGSFVGSDILAGILATGMHLRSGYSILVDLGTNGEIVIGNRERLLCASTAAGPAFEGATISCGMQATTGAIASIHSEGHGWKCRVIGDGKPEGICGSGLIDAVAVMREQRILGEFGEILSGMGEVPLEGTITLTQKDIQEFQLAKSALATGIEILLRKLSISRNEIDQLFIAGAFGSFLNVHHVNKTGMLPFPSERMIQLGNTALMGAKMFLFEGPGCSDSIRSITSHVNLESEPDFQDLFIQHLAFDLPAD